MYQYDRHFSLEEARATLPVLRMLLTEIHARRDRLHLADEKLGQMLQKTRADIGGVAVNTMLRDLTEVNERLRQICEMGIVIKDVDRGLVDFPALREGREVFLCWELDEDDIEFWHDLDAGYAGRERI
jgi:hypothetical protein